MSRVRLVVDGRVQGVGFRRFVERAASECRVAGWVRNLADGRVEIAAEGGERELDSFKQRVRRGPPGSVIHEVVDSALPDGAPLQRPFAILRD